LFFKTYFFTLKIGDQKRRKRKRIGGNQPVADIVADTVERRLDGTCMEMAVKAAGNMMLFQDSRFRAFQLSKIGG
jgi:hypothetical protein